LNRDEKGNYRHFVPSLFHPSGQNKATPVSQVIVYFLHNDKGVHNQSSLLMDLSYNVIHLLYPKFNPEFAVDVVARRRKPQRNEQLERFCDEGIFINMLRSKIVKQALQQGFSSRSRWLLQILGLTFHLPPRWPLENPPPVAGSKSPTPRQQK
jgi:hypothetical protein